MEAIKVSSDSEFDENAENAVAGPKKRGRPSKGGSKVDKVKSGRGRGRPPKNPEGAVERVQKTTEEKDANGISNGKRGRPSKVGKLKVGHAIVATGKGRGRPKTENGGQDDSPSSKKKSAGKGGRGRPRKEVSESDEERSADALDDSNNEDDDDDEEPKTVGRPATGAVNLNIERTGRGQGRPKKDVAEKRAAANSGNEDGTTPKKRGRPSGTAAPKQSSGKPRGRPKAAQADAEADSEEDIVDDENDNDNAGDDAQNNESNDEEFQEPEDN